MAKVCDNKSVGQIIFNGNSILLILRRNYPESCALPAGHVDQDKTFAEAAARETGEEVCLMVTENKLVFREETDNPCKREGGSHHLWEVYQAVSWSGQPKSGSDAKECFWATPEELARLAKRTEYFMKKYGIPHDKVGELTVAIFGSDPTKKQTDPEWQADMGLEPVWYYILKRIKLI